MVLELTLKHVRTLSTVLEQQQQKIMALQKDLRIGKFCILRVDRGLPRCVAVGIGLTCPCPPPLNQPGDHGGDVAENSEEMFRSGFHLCANEVLQYVARQESSRDLTPSHVISHIQKVAAEVLKQRSHTSEEPQEVMEKAKKPAGQPQRAAEGLAKNCVPVIQRTTGPGAGEQSGSDTDTDSGYGGEHDKRDPKAQWSERYAKEGELKQLAAERTAGAIKQEGDEPKAKRARSEPSEEEDCPSGAAGGYVGFSPNQPPFCLPFYLIPPSTAPVAAYLPMLEKCWYPGGMPVMYPGMSAEALPSSLGMSPRAASPVPHHGPLDSPTLHKALKQVPPLSLESRD